MGRIKKQPPVKLITGFIFKDGEYFCKAKQGLRKSFGEIDFESQEIPFNHTDYYQKEFGHSLKRKFISFKRLITPQSIVETKIITNRIEVRLSKDSLRRINIDPGYIDMAKLVLASTKDFRHRIYLNKGIFAEIALFYQNKSFRPWEWSYPDYRTQEYFEIFNQIRKIYASQIKNI